MTQDEIMKMAHEAGLHIATDVNWMPIISLGYAERFAKLVAEHEREACAKIFDEVMPLVPFAQNDQGGCLICGFTPKLAAKAIRARGQA